MRAKLQRLVSELMDCGIRLDQAVREFEREYIQAALEKNRGNRSVAARALGIHRNTLTHKIHHHKLDNRGPAAPAGRPRAIRSS